MASQTTSTIPRLQKVYKQELAAELKKSLKLENVHEVPRLTKIVVSVGLGKSKDEKRAFEAAENTLAKITGQHPIRTIARKSIAGFKLREGQPIGMKVTLRGARMYEFADRLINVVLPRLRDFHGVADSAFDDGANYNIGLPDQSVFPELSFEETAVSHGLQITLVTSAKSNEHARELLSALGMPFEKGRKE